MSSNEIAIKIEVLGKRYEIYDQPGDRLKQFLFPRLRSLFRLSPKQYFREFWALRDISFEVKRGETVGIIGRNGSGKSTLLQIICGTLTPTTGSVQTNGRIAALLELGSGFNPEFTGRENVYLNASVLGLTKEETDVRFDDIVAFADIGDFIDQPTKTYSSGMTVRLAFAVIAHVDADILVVDEALAVGDVIFVQKCMRFIGEFQKRGVLIFVSHDISAVQSICNSALWVKNGKIEFFGSSKDASEAYMQFSAQEIYGEEVLVQSLHVNKVDHPASNDKSLTELDLYRNGEITIKSNLNSANGWKTGTAEIIEVRFIDTRSGEKKVVFEGGESVRLTIKAIAHKGLQSPILGFLVKNKYGQDLFGENTYSFLGVSAPPIESGKLFSGSFEFTLPMLPDGQYSVMASVADGDLINHVQHHWLHDALILNVASSKVRYGLVGIPFRGAKFNVEG